MIRRSYAKPYRLSIAFGAIVAFTLVAALHVRAAAPEQPSDSISLLCVDSNEKPVAGAEVHIFQYEDHKQRYRSCGPFRSNADGRVKCDEVLVSNESGNFDRWAYARVPGQLVGVARTAKWTNRKIINRDFEVVLYPSCSVEGRVSVPSNYDPTRVTVRTTTLHIETGKEPLDFLSFPRDDNFAGLDTALPDIFDCRPDAAGRIRFHDVPVRGRLYLITAADGLGQAQWRNNEDRFDLPIEIEIEPESSVSGRVLSNDLKPVPHAQVTARLRFAGPPNQIFHLTTFRATADEDGRFEIHGLPQRSITLSIEDPLHRFAFMPREQTLPLPDEPRKRLLTMEASIPVSGRILDPDGKPVAGAGISAIADNEDGAGLSDDMSKVDGRYQLYLPSGVARLYFNSLPDGFKYPEPQIVKRLELVSGQASIENLDFTLPRAAQKDAAVGDQ